MHSVITLLGTPVQSDITIKQTFLMSVIFLLDTVKEVKKVNYLSFTEGVLETSFNKLETNFNFILHKSRA